MAHVPRLYIPGHLAPGHLHLEDEQAHRLAAVMRLRAGDQFLTFCGDGREWRSTVESVTKGGVDAIVGELARQEPLGALTVEVWCGLVRPNRFDWAIEKCVEAGADIVRPLVSEFAARGDGSSLTRQERWTRIAIEAAEQSGRLFVPAVDEPAPFAALLARGRQVPLVIAHAGGRPLLETAPLLPASGGVAVAIGPEGGLSDDEIDKATAQGALLLSLGPNVLRTETAAVVATAFMRGAV